jgi:hypothetical protein
VPGRQPRAKFQPGRLFSEASEDPTAEENAGVMPRLKPRGARRQYLFNRPVNRGVSLFRKLNSMVILLYSACADPLNSRGIDASRSSSAASPRATRINLS